MPPPYLLFQYKAPRFLGQSWKLFTKIIIKFIFLIKCSTQVKSLKADQETLEKNKDEAKQTQDQKRSELSKLKAGNRYELLEYF